MEPNKNPSMYDVVSRCVEGYNTDSIVGGPSNAGYQAGNQIVLQFPPSNSYLDLQNLALVFRPEYPAENLAGCYAATKPENFLSVTSVSINAQKMNIHEEQEGRNRITNFLQSLRQQTTVVDSWGGNSLVQAQVNASKDLLAHQVAATKALFYDSSQSLVDPHTAADQLPSLCSFQRQQKQAAKHRQKHFKYALTITSEVEATNTTQHSGDTQNYQYEKVLIKDICPELSTISRLPMMGNTLRIEIQFNPNNKVLTSGMNGAQANRNVYDDTDKYTIKDVCVYQKNFIIKDTMTQVVRDMSPVMPYNAFHIESLAFSGSILNLRMTTSQSRRLLGCLVFIQHKNFTGKGTSGGTANAGIDYDANQVPDNALVSYYDTSFFLQVSDIYLEQAGRRYRQNSLPLPNKQRAAYLVAQQSLASLFAGKQMSDLECDFYRNKCVYVINVNSGMYDGDKMDGNSVNLFIEASSVGKGQNITDYKATACLIFQQDLVFQGSSGVKIER